MPKDSIYAVVFNEEQKTIEGGWTTDAYWRPGYGEFVSLNGTFSLEDLEAILSFVRKHCDHPPALPTKRDSRSSCKGTGNDYQTER